MTDHVVPLDGTSTATKAVLGGKAYSINKMRALGLPVPPAFVLPTPVCGLYHAKEKALPDAVWNEVLAHVHRLEVETGRTFGRGPSPLLVSVRSGAAQSMPGMMDTVLNLGLTAQLRDALAAETGDADWAADTWSRFCASYADIVAKAPGELPPADPYEQLREAICAVFDSWSNARVQAYRERHNLGAGGGTAVTVQAMVFGNRDENSGTGVMFSRDPRTGENALYGEWLPKAQGEDVVSGSTTPLSLEAIATDAPEMHRELQRTAALLEEVHTDLVDIEFTVESGKLYVLQCRTGKRSPQAAVRIAVEMVREGLIERAVALARVTAEQAEQVATATGVADGHPILASGTAAGPGTAVGRAVGDIDEALDLAADGVPVVLVRPSTAPDDVPAMFESVAVVTELGGSTSHAALVCREIGLPCVVGCGPGTVERLVGRTVTVDGAAGTVYDGDVLGGTDRVHDEYLIELLGYLPTPVPDEHPLAATARICRVEAGSSRVTAS